MFVLRQSTKKHRKGPWCLESSFACVSGQFTALAASAANTKLAGGTHDWEGGGGGGALGRGPGGRRRGGGGGERGEQGPQRLDATQQRLDLPCPTTHLAIVQRHVYLSDT
jgi:hypothetical protein